MMAKFNENPSSRQGSPRSMVENYIGAQVSTNIEIENDLDTQKRNLQERLYQRKIRSVQGRRTKLGHAASVCQLPNLQSDFFKDIQKHEPKSNSPRADSTAVESFSASKFRDNLDGKTIPNISIANVDIPDSSFISNKSFQQEMENVCKMCDSSAEEHDLSNLKESMIEEFIE